jgi:hypothetical protein
MNDARLAMIAVLGLALSRSPARAEIMPLPLDSKRREATLILVGEVKRVSSEDRRLETESMTGGLVRLFDLVITVDAVEKGKGFNPGDLVHARCWRMIQFGRSKEGGFAHVGASGQFFIPSVGDRVRVFSGEGPRETSYLDGRDSLPVLMPNGIDRITPEGVVDFSSPQPLPPSEEVVDSSAPQSSLPAHDAFRTLGIVGVIVLLGAGVTIYWWQRGVRKAASAPDVRAGAG